jgi:hypothetical protein
LLVDGGSLVPAVPRIVIRHSYFGMNGAAARSNRHQGRAGAAPALV